MGGTYRSVREFASGIPQVALSSPSLAGTFVPDPIGVHGRKFIRNYQDTTSYRSSGRSGDIEISPNSSPGAFKTWVENEFPDVSDYDKGHEFSTLRTKHVYGLYSQAPLEFKGIGLTYSKQKARVSSPFFGVSYLHNGTWYDVNGMPPASMFQTSNDVASGKQAIAACAPTRPEANLSVGLAELIREGLPSLNFLSLLGQRTDRIRAAGSDYLNIQFGWLPLVRDVLDAVRALQKASRIFTQYSRDSGRNVRRGFHLPDLRTDWAFKDPNVKILQTPNYLYENSSGKFSMVDPGGVISNGLRAYSGSTSVSVSSLQKRYFKGSFTYYVPPLDSVGSLEKYEAYANKLLGTRLTPEVLWNLAPWSWLIDWVLRINDHMAVYSLFQDDDLVLRYGYLMVEDRLRTTATYDVESTSVTGAFQRTPGFQVLEYVRKRRVKSTPFGFGLNPTVDFDGRQWAILAALGMSKAPANVLKGP